MVTPYGQLLALVLAVVSATLAAGAQLTPPRTCDTKPLPAGPNCPPAYHIAADGKCYQNCKATYKFVPSTKTCVAVCGAYSTDKGDACHLPELLMNSAASNATCHQLTGKTCHYCNNTHIDIGWYPPCPAGLELNGQYCSWCLAPACPSNTVVDPENPLSCVKKTYSPTVKVAGRYCPAGYIKTGRTCVSKSCKSPPPPPVRARPVRVAKP